MRIALLLLFLALGGGCDRRTDDTLRVSSALGGDAVDGFARAIAPRDFRFPADHNAHPDFRNEWWYVTGQVEATDGERFGYQVTFFRIAIAAEATNLASAWATRQLWMAHAALTEIDGARHHHDERLARGAVGLSGQDAKPFQVWLEDWSIRGGDGGVFPWQITVASDDFDLALSIEPLRDPVLQGDAGLSQKSDEPGNASYYYSITRLATSGELRRGRERLSVTGVSWLDREWSTSALGDDQSGWDWFSLQLAGGRDLMLYRLRHRDGGTDRHSAGRVVDADGLQQHIEARDFELEAERWWTSEHGARYPVTWRLRVKKAELDLRVHAVLDDQEMQTAVRYWEGAVAVRDANSGTLVGRGYLEMTGYEP